MTAPSTPAMDSYDHDQMAPWLWLTPRGGDAAREVAPPKEDPGDHAGEGDRHTPTPRRLSAPITSGAAA